MNSVCIFGWKEKTLQNGDPEIPSMATFNCLGPMTTSSDSGNNGSSRYRKLYKSLSVISRKSIITEVGIRKVR